MLTGRTKQYVEALIREGDNFNPQQWYRDVREKDRAKALGSQSAGKSSYPVTPEPCPVTTMPWSGSTESGTTQQRSARPEPRKQTLRQRLAAVSVAWGDLQESRRRDSVYDYLSCVFLLVKQYETRGRARRLVRRTQKFAGVEIDRNAEPFATVIHATCDEELNGKMIEYSRVLRYAARSGCTSLKKFVVSKGGLNKCAALYAVRRRCLSRGVTS
jgi:hypothetical protein